MMSFNLRLLVTASCILTSLALSTPTAYGFGRERFSEYRSTLPQDFNVVKEGGWYALQQRYQSEVGKEQFKKNEPSLPEDFDVVSFGGFDAMHKLAVDPKAELVKIVVENLRTYGGTSGDDNSGKIDAIVALLTSQGKGFSSAAVDGDWLEVMARQGKKSTKSQKLVGSAKKAVLPTSDFNVKSMDFENTVLTKRGNGVLKASVKYYPVAKKFDKIDGRIIIRRINCDITGATFKYKRFPTLSLPFLKKSDGFLDFLYLDDDIRITRGNRGGLFIHFKPGFYEQIMS